MKATVFIISIIISTLFLFQTGCKSENTLEPKSYHDTLGFYYLTMDLCITDFGYDIWDTLVSLEELEKNYKLYNKMLDKNISELQTIPKLKDDPGLYEAVLNFYNTCKNVMDNEYKKIIEKFENNDINFNEINNIDSIATEKIIAAEEKVSSAQKEFAKKFNFELI